MSPVSHHHLFATKTANGLIQTLWLTVCPALNIAKLASWHTLPNLKAFSFQTGPGTLCLANIQHSSQYLWRNCSRSIVSNRHISYCLYRPPSVSQPARGERETYRRTPVVSFRSLTSCEKHSVCMLMTVAVEHFH